MRITIPSLGAVSLCGLLVAGGCDDGADTDVEDRACGLAVEEVRACYGPEMAVAFADGCTPERAARVQTSDCTSMASVLLEPGANAKSDDPVAEAIRDVLRRAIEQGLVAAVEQVLDRLGGVAADDYGAYLLVETTADRAEAERAAARWRDALQGHAGFAPTVVEYDSGFGIAHAPCVLGLSSVLPRIVAELVTGTPDTIEILGGEVYEVQESETKRHVEVSLPLVLLPQRWDDGEHPACD